MSEFTIYSKLIVALIAGAIVGWQREKMEKFAGIRTHMLVCAGSALVMAMGFELFHADTVGRLATGIVTGLGFLGAGSIIKSPGKQIEGLTSAATIWITGIIGIVVGGGFYVVGLVTSVLTVGTLLWKKESFKKRRIKKSKD